MDMKIIRRAIISINFTTALLAFLGLIMADGGQPPNVSHFSAIRYEWLARAAVVLNVLSACQMFNSLMGCLTALSLHKVFLVAHIIWQLMCIAGGFYLVISGRYFFAGVMCGKLHCLAEMTILVSFAIVAQGICVAFCVVLLRDLIKESKRMAAHGGGHFRQAHVRGRPSHCAVHLNRPSSSHVLPNYDALFASADDRLDENRNDTSIYCKNQDIATEGTLNVDTTYSVPQTSNLNVYSVVDAGFDTEMTVYKL